MTDLLRMDLINALPHPLQIREFSHDWWWPLIDIDVQSGLYRIDVCGLSQTKQVGGCDQIMDDAGNIHDIDIFYTDSEPEQEAIQ